MGVSKSQVDKAGRILAEAADPDIADLASQSAIVDEWRASHGNALLWVAESLQERARRVCREVAVGQRLKRKPQIVAKLRRSNTRLAQMQDIGGCRAILPSTTEVAELSRRMTRPSQYYGIGHLADYREEARATGYRALHVVVIREDRQIEVQLRTLRQQAWAEAVERASNRSGFNLKAGEGPEDILGFFELASEGFSLLDASDDVPIHLRKKLRSLRRRLDDYLPEAKPLRRSEVAHIRPRSFRSRLNNWLIVYDWRKAQFSWWSDVGANTARAAEAYAAFEERYRYEDGYEVVLIGADSTRTIQKTHAHYFGKDPNDIDPLGYFGELLG